jgi:short-subunit dehydrogenase
MKKVKVIVITGSSSGIGLITSEYLASKNAIVYGLSRSGQGSNVNQIKCDVTNREQIETAFEEIYQKEGRIDAVINNAGMGVSGAIEYSTDEELQKIMDLNVLGVVKVSQIAIPYLRKTKGKIINIGSVAGSLTIPFQAYYSMTKASVAVFSEALRMELRPFGIKVTTVLPGDTKTNFTKNRNLPKVFKDEIYHDRIMNSIKRMEKDETNGVSPLKVSKVIYKVINKKNPPVKITVGFTYKTFVFLKRFLPDRLINYVLYKMYAK